MARGTVRRFAPEQAPRADIAVDDLDLEGRGVGRVAGKVVFVEGALPGETVRARYTTSGRRFDEAVTESVPQPAAERVAPFCPVFDRCGGCTLQHFAAAGQARAKERHVAAQLERALPAAADTWLEPLAGLDRGYRARARFALRALPGRGVLLGFREQQGRHVVDIDACDVLDARIGGRIAAFRALVAGLSRPDRVPELEVAAGDDAVGAVLRCLAPPSDADRERLRRFQSEQGVRLATRGRGAAPVQAVDPACPPELRYALPDEAVMLSFAPTDFIQSNLAVNRALVNRVMGLLAPRDGERVLDLFCGIGNFSLPAARRGAAVTGLEGDAALVERAAANARANGLEGRAHFAATDLTTDRLARWLDDVQPHAVILDPPRSGAREAARVLAARRPPRIVYVSCDPATLARDLGHLVAEGPYSLRAAGIADMFPHTGHVESMAYLETAQAPPHPSL